MEQLEFALEQPENDTFELVSQARSLLDSLKLMENLPDYNQYKIEVNGFLNKLRVRLDSLLEERLGNDRSNLREMAQAYEQIDLLDSFAGEFLKRRNDKCKTV